jgi:DNA-binding MarR family transcriptional regulator
MNNSSGERPPEEGAPQESAILSWIEAGYLLGGRLEKALEEQGLSMTKLKVLSHLAASRQSLSLSEIAARVNCVRSNITQVVDRLEEEGLVRRLFDPSDRRTVRAELTEAGRGKQEAGTSVLEKTQAELAAGLSEADVQALGRLAAAFK